jgi:hypothetical protein
MALMLGWVLVACEGSAAPPTSRDNDAGSSGLDAGGGSRDSGTAPECGSNPVPFVPVLVQASAGFTTEWSGPTPARVRLVERGAGLPPGGTHLDFSAYRDQVGWLRLGAPDGERMGAVGDAGAIVGDAGALAGDAGVAVGDAGDTGVDVPTFIVGPRALVDLPVAIGSELVLSMQHATPLPLYPGADRVVLEQGDRVLLFHEDGFITSPEVTAGFSRTTGATVCETSWGCADSYGKALRVTVPGGATATLAPGQTDTIGAYQVSHGNTTSVIRRQPHSCTDLLFDLTNSQITAVLLSDAE